MYFELVIIQSSRRGEPRNLNLDSNNNYGLYPMQSARSIHHANIHACSLNLTIDYCGRITITHKQSILK